MSDEEETTAAAVDWTEEERKGEKALQRAEAKDRKKADKDAPQLIETDNDCYCGCGRKVSRVVGETGPRYYFSSWCALRGLAKRMGWKLPEREAVESYDTETDGLLKEPREKPKRVPPPPSGPKPVDPDTEEHRTLRYGPMRRIVEVITAGRTSNEVRLDCNHTKKGAAAGAKQSRCKLCAPAETETAP